MKKVVFAGGTHSGKTTLIDYFRSAGYPVLSESGIEVVNELIAERGWDEYRIWRKKNPDEFLRRIFLRQIESEKTISDGKDFVFFDRGILDYAAMAAHLGLSIPPDIVTYAQQNPYDAIFICDTLAAEDARLGEGRFFTTTDSLKIGEHAERLYREYGYNPFRLPDVPIEERVQKVKEVLDI
jgi:predicted ATPase